MTVRSQTLILISDGLPAANGGGISQTLYNLLDGWQGQLYFVSRPGEKPISGPVIDAKLVTHQFERYKGFGIRVLKKLNGRILKASFNRQQKLKKIPDGLPTAAEAFVLVSTTEPIKLQFAWLLQERFGYKVIPYFMDDWMGGLELNWKGYSIHDVVSGLLCRAPCWLMISRQLEETLVKRYGLMKKPTLVVHNPAPGVGEQVTDDGRQTTDDKLQTTDNRLPTTEKTIIYAGSIWPMHFDALQAVAKAVQLLALQQAQGDGVRLVIYTSEAAWEHNRKGLEGPGIEYGGFIPYAEIPAKLAAGWLLLVTASFLPQYAPFTNSSVQTKLTDYMAAGKPVLFVGPAEGASGQFIHEWDCGYTIGTDKPEDIAEQLLAIASMTAASSRKAQNALGAARGYFNKPVVQQRLYDFLDKHTVIARREDVIARRHDEAIL